MVQSYAQSANNISQVRTVKTKIAGRF